MASVASRLPNVLFILVDDMGIADPGFSARITRRLAITHRFGNAAASAAGPTSGQETNDEWTPPLPTPNLDILASRSVVLTSLYTHPLCAPSRTALYTGKYAGRFGNLFPVPNGPDLPDLPTFLPKQLKSVHGYQTHLIGKWGVDMGGPVGSGLGPTERGFDSFYGFYFSGHSHFTKNAGLMLGVDWHDHRAGGVRKDYPEADPHNLTMSTEIFTQKALDVVSKWLPPARAHGSPEFLMLSYSAPHDPVVNTQELKSDARCHKWKSWRRRVYCSMVLGLDIGIGQIIKALESNGVLEETVVIFTSDNGGTPLTTASLNYPYRGAKNGLWEGGVKVPGFIFAPALFNIQQQSNRNYYCQYPGLFHFSDWLPTLLDLVSSSSSAGPPGPNQLFPSSSLGSIDGTSQFSALKDFSLRCPLPSSSSSSASSSSSTDLTDGTKRDGSRKPRKTKSRKK
eukprot:gb/GEZN01005974.1/.p1 GENE.gb/GEZN01005974.1/~~gb/GEZN01005974.1/.p1  ORF type:complete len:480 (+),score=57.79 gb/GEZN01005974.1/:83-1441(+)